jgi:hypothetical protein
VKAARFEINMRRKERNDIMRECWRKRRKDEKEREMKEWITYGVWGVKKQ